MSTTEDHKEKIVYELGYLILPSIPEENLSDVVSTLQGIVKKSGGVEIASENPLKIDLAYAMSKTVGARKYVVKDAYIGWMKFELEPSEIESVKTGSEKLDEVLRVLIIRAPRESVFTFASAQKAIEEAEKALSPEDPGAEVPQQEVAKAVVE